MSLTNFKNPIVVKARTCIRGRCSIFVTYTGSTYVKTVDYGAISISYLSLLKSRSNG